MKATIQFEIPRPPAEVFALIGDLERAPEWVPDLVSMEKLTSGEVRVGTRYKEVVKLGSKTAEAELEITEFEPPRVFAHRGEGGPSSFTGRFVLEPTETGTRVTHDYTVKMTGAARLLSPMIKRWVRKNAAAGIEGLERMLS